MGFSCLLRWKELLLHCAAKSDGPSEGLGDSPLRLPSTAHLRDWSSACCSSGVNRPDRIQPVRRPRSPATMGPIFRFVFSPRTIPTGVIAVSHSTARSPVHHATSREEHLLRHVNTNFDGKVDPPGRSSSSEPAASPSFPQRGSYACGFGPEPSRRRRNRRRGQALSSAGIINWSALLPNPTLAIAEKRRQRNGGGLALG